MISCEENKRNIKVVLTAMILKNLHLNHAMLVLEVFLSKLTLCGFPFQSRETNKSFQNLFTNVAIGNQRPSNKSLSIRPKLRYFGFFLVLVVIKKKDDTLLTVLFLNG